MKLIVNGEEPFKAPAPRFVIGQTSAGYTLEYGVDGENFTPWDEASEAEQDVVVTNAVPGMFIKLTGNADSEVVVRY